MDRSPRRVITLVGLLCLAGQAAVLLAAGRGVAAPAIRALPVFVVLTVVVAACAVVLARWFEGSRPTRAASFGPWLMLAGALAMLAGGLALRGAPGAAAPGVAGDDLLRGAAARIERTVARLPAGTALIADRWAAAGGSAVAPRGSAFRDLAQIVADVMPADDDAAPGAVVWRADERVAWTSAAWPLPRPAAGGGPELIEIHDGMVLRCAEPRDDALVEVQVRLARRGALAGDPSVSVTANPAAAVANQEWSVTLDVSGLQTLHLARQPEAARAGTSARARLLVLAWGGWLLAVAGAAALMPAWWAPLLAWLARGVLAGAELRNWLAAAHPAPGFPAAPSAWSSLLDPAYFATPFAWGWFASTADALVTALLLGWTVRRLALWRLRADAGEGPSWIGRIPRTVRALAAGAAAGAALTAAAAWCELVAGNANPRLIGTGASLSAISFWGLHAVLLATVLSLLVVGALAASALRGRARASLRDTWVGLPAAAAAAGVVGLAGVAPAGMAAAAGIGLIVWLGLPAALSTVRVARRLVWPALVLVTALWIHTCLHEVYGRAETAWLERRASLITDADPDWTRFLLGSVLAEMQQQDTGPDALSGGEIWRDEPAWRLWQQSALRDLGYSCLVEILAADERSVSWYARGFLRDYRYEVADRSDWTADPAGAPLDAVFQTERRIYLGGEEEIVVAEAPRLDGRGWLRVEMPVRSWRLSTLLAGMTGRPQGDADRYRPRAEIDRPVLLLLADDSGWLRAEDTGFPAADADARVADLREGRRAWARIEAGGDRWLCRWTAVPPRHARTPGEGFLIGLRLERPHERLLDISRLMLLDLALFGAVVAVLQALRWLAAGGRLRWRPGFQEKFLAGYLLLGFVLLAVVGVAVDRVGYQRVRAEARAQTRQGLATGVEQLRSLLSEQARSLAESNYIGELLRGQLAGERPVGSEDVRQGMVFLADGTLVLDETLSDLDDDEAAGLLDAARSAPMILVRDQGGLYAATVIPIDLGDDILAAAGGPSPSPSGHGGTANNAFFLYRQVLDTSLLGGLADLLRGEVSLSLGGEPVLSSHPADYFAGSAPLMPDPDLMAALADHPHGASVAPSPGRPFAFVGAQPLPALLRGGAGRLAVQALPAALTVSFPDRERDFADQRRATILFLAGLANLILLTALMLAALMGWNLFRPLRVLLAATQSLARGDYAAPLPEAGHGEVGRLAGAFGAMRRQLQGARDELAERERFLATVLERVPVGVAVLDGEGELAALNPAGETILAAFAPDAPFTEGVRRMHEALRRAAAGGAAAAAGELTGAGGRRTLRGALAPMADPAGGSQVMVVFEDITEFLAHKKSALNAELARQVAHEIKNPLTPIQLSAQLLGQAWRDGHPERDRIIADGVARILEQVDLLRRIASEFSLLGRPDELAVAPLDLPEVTRRVIARYDVEPGAGPLPNGLRVTAAAGGDDPDAAPPVLAHEESLLKILGNLMQNSLDAAREDTPLEIQLGWRIGAASVTLIWRDNGTGLDADVADRLFDPYFSTKSKGTGLGLAICRSLAERMGGTISLADRDDGPGAEARLALPVAPPGVDVSGEAS